MNGVFSGGSDIFRPLTGRHRTIVFEALASLYERMFGMAADFLMVPDRDHVRDVVAGSIRNSRYASPEVDDEDDGIDDETTPEDYARFVVDRLLQFGILVRRNDTASRVVVFVFSTDGKKIARFCAELKRKGSGTRQRSIRACEAALSRFVVEEDHVYLLDAFEFARTIFDDICQAADLFAEYREDVLRQAYENTSDVLDRYLELGAEFDQRASRYLRTDNPNTHAPAILDAIARTRLLHPATTARLDAAIRADAPAIAEMSGRLSTIDWICDAIERVVCATRDVKLPELEASGVQFHQRYVAMIHLIRRRRFRNADDPVTAFAEVFRTADARRREIMASHFLEATVPFRSFVHDYRKMSIDPKAERARTPRLLAKVEPTRDDLLATLVRDLEGNAFSVSLEEVADELTAFAATHGVFHLSDLPVRTVRDVLIALSSVEAVVGGFVPGLVTEPSGRYAANGIFSAPEHVFRKVPLA